MTTAIERIITPVPDVALENPERPLVCWTEDIDWLRYLLTLNPDAMPNIEAITVFSKGFAEEQFWGTLAIMKPVSFGAPTWLCLTSDAAGFIAADTGQLAAEIKESYGIHAPQELGDAIVLRPFYPFTEIKPEELSSVDLSQITPQNRQALDAAIARPYKFWQPILAVQLLRNANIVTDRSIFWQNIINYAKFVEQQTLNI
jgi:hypothetical protein